MTYIGCDPGKKGSLAIIQAENIKIVPFEGKEYIKHLFALDEKDCVAVVEQVHSISKQGLASTFAFGMNFGWILGVFDSAGIPYQLVSPQKWKKEFGCTSDKTTSIEVCKRLFPNVSLKRTERCKKDDDGFAEALLMALYAKRHF